MSYRSTGGRRRFAAGMLVVLLVSLVAVPAGAQVEASEPLGVSRALRQAVSVEGVRRHQRVLQSIADVNGGNRASGRPGYDDSARYVSAVLRAAGYRVSSQEFDYQAFEELEPPTLVQIAPQPKTYTKDVDFALLRYSGSGRADAPVTPIDLQLGPDNTSTSGCEASDFAGFPPGRIALVQRGACTFALKATNAEAAGASAVVIFNQGNTDDRKDLLHGTLGEDATVALPVVGLGYDLGVSFAELADEGLVLRVVAEVFRGIRRTANVFAESRRGDQGNAVMAGAHLDSVHEGPGINDNGSGVATLVEVALGLAAERPGSVRNQVRFAFWGAEEAGLVGSQRYVEGLSATERDRIALYLNFDMVGSPNFVRFVYDGDGSTFDTAGPPGSGAVEAVFARYFAAVGLASEPTVFDGRSDYAPFVAAGVPAGGLFTGAEELKTPEQAAVYGGISGAPNDPCYHQACDTFDNVSLVGLDQMADAVAHAVATFARSTEEVDGARGRTRPAAAG